MDAAKEANRNIQEKLQEGELLRFPMETKQIARKRQ